MHVTQFLLHIYAIEQWYIIVTHRPLRLIMRSRARMSLLEMEGIIVIRSSHVCIINNNYYHKNELKTKV